MTLPATGSEAPQKFANFPKKESYRQAVCDNNASPEPEHQLRDEPPVVSV
jgi:hypothetical protein